MKQYAIGLITGILLTASAVMFMGATSNDEVGRYQMSTTSNKTYIIDSTNGEMWRWDKGNSGWNKFIWSKLKK